MYFDKVVKCTITKTKRGFPCIGQTMVIEMRLQGKNSEAGTVKDIDTTKGNDAKFVPVDIN